MMSSAGSRRAVLIARHHPGSPWQSAPSCHGAGAVIRRGPGRPPARAGQASSSRTPAANASTSASVVSKEHIQRTSPVAAVPVVEAEPLAQPLDGVLGQEREHRVRLDRLGDRRPRRCRRTAAASRAAIALAWRGVAQPQVAGQQRDELGRDEPHLRGQLHVHACAGTAAPRPASGRARRPPRRACSPFFVPPKEMTSTPASAVNVAHGTPSDAAALDEPGAVHVDRIPWPWALVGRSPGSPRRCTAVPSSVVWVIDTTAAGRGARRRSRGPARSISSGRQLAVRCRVRRSA